MIFRGPRRSFYTPAEFAEAYGVRTVRVLGWLKTGFLRAITLCPGQYRISEASRRIMEQYYGVPDEPKCRLP